jgi:hypothetical protein
MTTGKRAQIALLFYSTFNVVVFTAAVYATSLFPPLTANAGFWLAAIMAVSLTASAPVAWCLGACLPREWHDKLLAKRSPLSHAPAREI